MSCSDMNTVAAAAWDGSGWNSSFDAATVSWMCSGTPAFGGLASGTCDTVANLNWGTNYGTITINARQ
jgi:hypothetical protein